MNKNLIYAFAAIMLLGILEACSQNPNGKLTTTESGLSYRFFEKNEGDPAGYGKIIRFHMVLKDNRDTVFQDTYKAGQPFELELAEPEMMGGIEEGLAMMAAGDSAEFRISIDSLFKGRMEQIPQELQGASYLAYFVKMESFQTREAFETKREEEAAARRIEQDEAIQNYMAANNLEGTKTESGIYYIPQTKGSDEKPGIHNEVTFHYTGTLLDGTVFDSSIPGRFPGKQVNGEPISYPLQGLIPGWQEGLALMGKGEKAILIIPSEMGYGAQSMGNIPAHSILVFEIELVDFN